MEDECAAVCYPIVKPLLRYFEKCQDKDAKYFQLQDKYVEVLEKNSNLLLQLEEVNRQYGELQLNSREKDLELMHLKAQMTRETVFNSKEILGLNKTCGLGTLKNQFGDEVNGEMSKSKSLTLSQTEGKLQELAHLENKKQNVLVPTDRCRATSNGTFEVQEIQIPITESFKVVCRSSKDFASKFMMVYRKLNNSTEFNRTFEQYASGFGDVGIPRHKEFFVGLERLHLVTNRNPHELFIFMYPSATRKLIRCDNFVLGSRSEGYMVKTLNNCTGDGDSSILSQGLKFSTFDLDEESPDRNNEQKWGFGWWMDSGCVFEFRFTICYIPKRKTFYSK